MGVFGNGGRHALTNSNLTYRFRYHPAPIDGPTLAGQTIPKSPHGSLLDALRSIGGAIGGPTVNTQEAKQ